MKRLSIALIVMMTAGAMLARGNGQPGHGQGPGPEGFGGPGNLIVTSDGTAIVTRVVSDSATNSATVTLTAISTSGATAWSVTLQDRGRITLSGNNLLTVGAGSSEGTSAITARSVTTGAVAWTATFTGRVTDLEPYSGGTYAIVVVPPATQGGTATRSLVAISSSGATLWTKSL